MSTNTLPEKMLSPLFAPDKKIVYVEKDIPKPGPGQLLLNCKANALCGSEKHFYYHGSKELTPGHEAAGIVVAAGSGTTTKLSTPGVVFLMDFCGECRSCKQGFTNQCSSKRADMGFSHDGGYGEYMLINENIFFPVDEDLSLTDATLLLDIMGTGGHAMRRALLVRKDIESVLIAGAGPIGLGILAMVKIMLGKHIPVYLTDVIQYRLDLARQLGGIPVHASNDDLKEILRQDGLSSVDVAFDSSGLTAARLSCLEHVGQRGALICVGHGGEVSLEVSPGLIAPERAILGSEYFAFSELEANAKYLREHRDYLAQIITHRFPVSRMQEACDLFFSGQCGKVVVEQ